MDDDERSSLEGSYTAGLAQLDTSLPTPPHSPERSLRPSRPIDSTIRILESLVAFYHQERMWVYRTRASLELVLETPPSGGSDSAMSSADSDVTMEDDGNVPTSTFSVQAVGGINSEPTSPSGSRSTLWMRRKKGFKLKLEGISTRGKRRQMTLGHEVSPTPGIQILALFEDMMTSRMESCERISKLVKDANKLKDDLRKGLEYSHTSLGS